MGGGFAVNILLGLAIAGLLILITVLVKKYYTTFEGFFQATSTTKVDIDTYMNSVSAVVLQTGVEQERDVYYCANSSFQLRQRKCYPPCPPGFIGSGSKCVPTSANPDARPNERRPICDAKFEFDPTGPRDPECTPDGSGGTPVCAGCTTNPITKVTTCLALPQQPTCFPICKDKMTGTGSKCLKPNTIPQPSTQVSTSNFSCPKALKTRYIRIEGNQYMGISLVMAIDEFGNNVAEGKPTFAADCNEGPSHGGSYWERWCGCEKNPVKPGKRSSSGLDRSGLYYARDIFGRDGSAGPWWVVDLGAEYELQSLTVFGRNDNYPERENLQGKFVYLIAANRKINYRLSLTRRYAHNWRFYDGGATTYKEDSRVGEIARFLFNEYRDLYPDLQRAYADHDYNGLRNHYNDWGRHEKSTDKDGNYGVRKPNALPNAGIPNGTTKAHYILIEGKNDWLHLEKFEVFESDGTPSGKLLTITQSMVATQARFRYSDIDNNDDRSSSTIINNNLAYIHIEAYNGDTYNNGDDWIRKNIGWTSWPSIWINLGREVQIERIVVTNRRKPDLAHRLNGFVMTLWDASKTMIWTTALGSARRQEYQINFALREEFGTCTSLCPYNYSPEKDGDRQPSDPNYGLICRSTMIGNTDSFKKNHAPRIINSSCRTGIKVDVKRFENAGETDSRCMAAPARRGRNYYLESGGALPRGMTSADVDYLVEQNVYTYCDIRGDEKLETLRDIAAVSGCPANYTVDGTTCRVNLTNSYRINPSDNCPANYSKRQEVFLLENMIYTKSQAAAACAAAGATVATYAQLEDAQRKGANWCRTGWVSDRNQAFYPITTETGAGCGNGSAGIKEWTPPGGAAGVNCFGVRPAQGTSIVNAQGTSLVRGFNLSSWYDPDPYFCTLNLAQTTNPGAITCPTGFVQQTLTNSEVYHLSDYSTTADQAESQCAAHGGRVATKEELKDAWRMGAEWCSWGWVRESATDATIRSIQFPMQETRGGCGARGIVDYTADAGTRYGVNCIGIKPKPGTPRVINFNTNSYYNTKRPEYGSPSFTMCVRKLPSDLAQEEARQTVNYGDNVRCMAPCQDGFEPDYLTRQCRPTAALNTYNREAQRRAHKCPTVNNATLTYDADYQRCYGNCPNNYTPVGKYCFPPGTRIIHQDASGVDTLRKPLSCPTGTELRADNLCYPPCLDNKIPVPGRCLPPVLNASRYGGNATIKMPNLKDIAARIYSLDTFMDQTNVKDFIPPSEEPAMYIFKDGNFEQQPKTFTPAKKSPYNHPLFKLMAGRDSSAPVNLMYDWFTTIPSQYTVDTSANFVTAIVYGPDIITSSGPIKVELDESLALARRVYLGSPTDVEKFLMVRWDDEKPYIRKAGITEFFVPEAIQVFDKTNGLNQFRIIANPARTANTGNAMEITPEVFSRFTGPARNFIKKWVAARTNRLIREKWANESADSLRNRLGALKELDIPSTVTLDISKKEVLNDLAQTFYQYTNGRFIMTYIYDAFTLGNTMVDLRFDMTQHGDVDESPQFIGTKMNTLNTRYTKVGESTVSQDIVDEAKDNYQTTLGDLQLAQTENTRPPSQGMVGRFFYTTNSITGKIMFTGFTLDANVVTSFLRGLNCGLDTPKGQDPGNVNFSPVTRYTMNASPSLICSQETTIRRAMSDYVDAISDSESGLSYPAGTTQWDLSGTLVVDEVTGALNINGKPGQCAYSWKETVYNEGTNQPVTGLAGIQRHAIFTYNSNEDDWYANERVFDLSGFRFLTAPSVPDCKWTWQDYKDNVGARLFGADEAQALEDYRLLGMRENRSPCPSVNPGYVLDGDVYINVPTNTDLPRAFNYANDKTNALLAARKHFFEWGYKEGRVLSPAFTIPALSTPVRLNKPLPAEEKLTTENNEVCQPKTCENAEVLYRLVQEYNGDPEYPGVILRVTKAITPGENTCHVEADVNWDTMIADSSSTSGAQVKKGAEKIPAGATGVQRGVKFEFSVDLDPSDCTYSLEDAEVGKGVNIQANTPALYKPLEFATEARAESATELSKYAGEVTSVAQSVLDASKRGGLLYRQNTYTAAQQIGGAGAPTAAQVQAAGVWPPPASIAAKRLAAEAALREGFQARPASGALAPPPIKEVRALDTQAFGRDSARNLAQNFALKDMYAMPLDRNGAAAKKGGGTPLQGPAAAPLTPFETALRNQTVAQRAAALHAKPAQVGLAAAANEDARAALHEEAAYKYLRFRPLGTRSAAAGAVSIGRISFFYKGTELAIGQAKATNPMGDWGGSIADITGAAAGGFHDPYKKALVLAFPLPILVDGFSFTTARGARSAAEDPVTWKLEGSHNGTFWQVLHEQIVPFPVPMKRGENLPLFKF